jgi:transporter family-2 protein
MGALWPLLGILAGAFIALQAPINADLGRGLGLPVAAAAASFISGALILAAVTAFFTQTQGVTLNLKGPSPLLFVAGGALGGAYVTCVILLVPKLGTAATMAFVVAGQLIAGMLLDRIGFMGMPVHEISPGRIAGALLLFCGALLIRLY